MKAHIQLHEKGHWNWHVQTCAHTHTHARTFKSDAVCLPALIKGLFSTQHSPPVLNISTHTCTHSSSRQNTTTEGQTEEEIVSTLTFHLSSTLICQCGCCSDFLSARCLQQAPLVIDYLQWVSAETQQRVIKLALLTGSLYTHTSGALSLLTLLPGQVILNFWPKHLVKRVRQTHTQTHRGI